MRERLDVVEDAVPDDGAYLTEIEPDALRAGDHHGGDVAGVDGPVVPVARLVHPRRGVDENGMEGRSPGKAGEDRGEGEAVPLRPAQRPLGAGGGAPPVAQQETRLR